MNIIKPKCDNIFYNVQINPNNNREIDAVFLDNRSETILSKANDYKMSVVRARIPSNTLPLFIFPNIGVEGARVPNNNYYSISLRNLSTDQLHTSFINFIPQDSLYPVGVEAHYYIYSFRWFLRLVNTALAQCFNSMVQADPTLKVNAAPYFKYDEQYDTISLIVEMEYVEKVYLYTNEPLQRFFDGFDCEFLSINESETDNRIIIFNNLNNYHSEGPLYIRATTSMSTDVITGQFERRMIGSVIESDGILKNTRIIEYISPTSVKISSTPTQNGTFDMKITKVNLLVIKQEFDSTFNWISLRSVVFVSNLLPVNTELLPNLVGTTTDYKLNILTDIEVHYEKGSDLRKDIIYNPTAQYRYITLKSVSDIKQLDIRVYWRDIENVIRPLRIYPLTAPVTMKILFEKIV